MGIIFLLALVYCTIKETTTTTPPHKLIFCTLITYLRIGFTFKKIENPTIFEFFEFFESREYEEREREFEEGGE